MQEQGGGVDYDVRVGNAKVTVSVRAEFEPLFVYAVIAKRFLVLLAPFLSLASAFVCLLCSYKKSNFM